jgi:TonB family protein
VTISEGGELTLHDIDSMARPIYQPAPKWPPSQPIAQYDKDPVVVLKFVVKHDGTTARFEVESATAEAFAEAAIAAVQDWRFEPATKDGAPVSVAVLQPIVFPIPLFSPSLKADSSERRVMMRDMPERRSVDGVRGAEIKRDLLESTPFARFVKDKAKADSRFWRVELPGKAGLYHWEGVKITTRGGRMTDYQLNPVARLRAPE